MVRTRVAIIGLGRWGRKLARVFHSQSDLVLCCNRTDREAHRWLAEHYPDVRSSFDADEALNDPSIEAVVIATPIATHASLALRALEAGKHVFVEKPLSDSVADAERVAAAARSARRSLFVGYTYLFHPAFEEICRATSDDPVLHARLHWSKFGTFREDPVWNLVSHEIAIALTLFRESPEAIAVLENRPARSRRDYLSLRLELPSRRTCSITVDRCSPRVRKGATIWTRSGALLDWEGDALVRMRPGQEFDPVPVNGREPLETEVATFLAHIRQGGRRESEGRFDVEVVRALAEIDRLAGSGVS